MAKATAAATTAQERIKTVRDEDKDHVDYLKSQDFKTFKDLRVTFLELFRRTDSGIDEDEHLVPYEGEFALIACRLNTIMSLMGADERLLNTDLSTTSEIVEDRTNATTAGK